MEFTQKNFTAHFAMHFIFTITTDFFIIEMYMTSQSWGIHIPETLQPGY